MNAAEPILPASRSFSAGTGKGVKVAVVDSGINAHHSHIQRVAGGVQIRWEEDDAPAFGEDYRDSLGHGTAIAGVIRAKAPDAELYSVKVFDGDLRTHARVVAAAIGWAAEQRMHVVNVSLSTSKAEHRALLQQACDEATQRGVILVAAGDEPGRDVFPASFANVIGVAGDERCGWDQYVCCPGESIEFRAHPHPRPLRRRPQKFNLRGHSFAAAHITALIARILEQHPAAQRSELIEILAANATPGPESAGVGAER